MRRFLKVACAFALGGLSISFCFPKVALAQDQVMGQVRFDYSSSPLKNSGVWVDGEYVGFLGELRGMNRLRLLPGDHEITVRQAGYDDISRKVLIEPRTVLDFPVKMERDPRFVYPDLKTSSEVRLAVQPGRAAVFMDDQFIGNVDEYYGLARAMLVAPGKHDFKIALPGYRTFETEVTLLPRQKFAIRTELVHGSINDAGPMIRTEAPRASSSVTGTEAPEAAR